MNNDAIIFDVDGTLWNACPACAEGWNMGLAKLGINQRVTSKQIESVAGKPYEECIEILLPGLQERYPNLLETFNKYETEMVRLNGGEFYEGAIEGVKELSKSHKVFLVSNCQGWYLEAFLKLSGIESILTGFDCHGMSGLPKHEMLTRMKNKYSLKNPVYIGDTEGDESAASLAGMEFIHVSYGFGSPVNDPVSVDSFTGVMGGF